MVTLTIGDYMVYTADGDPVTWPNQLHASGAKIRDRLELSGDRGLWCGLRVDRRGEPCLELAISYANMYAQPRILLVPETSVLFLEVGERIYVYDLDAGAELGCERITFHSWRWVRHADTVLVVAELELIAWDVSGTKLWAALIEPPHDVSVRDGVVYVEADRFADSRASGSWCFPLRAGPGNLVTDDAKPSGP